MTTLKGIDPVVLEGRHVRLEPLTRDHLDGLCAVGLDPELWRWTINDVRTPEHMRAYVETALAWVEEGSAMPFATIERATGTIAGSTRYGNFEREQKRVEIGWTWLGTRYQRTALNTEAKYLMLRHAFETLGLNRVELKTDALNAKSRAAILRIGAQEEGVLRRHAITETGRIRDTVYYSVIAEEWPTVKVALEEKLRAAAR